MCTRPPGRDTTSDLPGTLADALAARTASFAVGVQGAVAEFHWVAGDRVLHRDGPLSLATARGAVRIATCPEVAARVLPAAHGAAAPLVCWLARRDAALDAPPGLTELGPDEGAVRPGDRSGVLFDLGLGLGHVRACVRSVDPALLDVLRAHAGEPLLTPGGAALAAIRRRSPQRVFLSRIARIEVYQPIPSRGARTPQGPHTHLLPSLLGRDDPAQAHLPRGARAVLIVYPAG